MRLLLKRRYKRTCTIQCLIKVVYAKEQEQSIARFCMARTGKGRMLMGAPTMQAEQDCPVCVEDLPEVIVGGVRCRLTK